MARAQTYDEIAPLIELCKKGRLFEVQSWIAEGKPINLPLTLSPKERKKSPLQITIDMGFYSLVQVLVENGTSLEEPRYLALRHALEKRRMDMVQLLVKNGADIHSVSMKDVFETWDKEIIQFFIENGADCETDQPLAYAFCSRIYPALAIYMQYKDRFPHFQDQLNVALRHHCREGNLKWVSLLLWAGGDPYTKGPLTPNDSPEDYMSALEWAAFWGHFDIFKLKAICLDPALPGALDLLGNACYGEKADLLKKLLERGFSPKNLHDRGTSLIQSLFNMMNWESYDPRTNSRTEKDLDTSITRQKLKMIHLLVRYGARWEPEDKSYINDIRRVLLKMDLHYTMEFIWIMTEYNACSPKALEKLMDTPGMRLLIVKYRHRYEEMMGSLRTLNDLSPTGA